jgi:hypothetical protein
MKSTVITPQLERGILTSFYKQEIRKNIRATKLKSVSGMKSLVLNHQRKIVSEAGTILRVSFFAIVIICMTF